MDFVRSRFTRLLYRSSETLSRNHAGLDDAVKQSWPVYTPGPSGWTVALNHSSEWVTTDTCATLDSTMQVHYNLYSGELLVNGAPLDQPPNAYREQPLFKALFGDSIVHVLPASKAGFVYSTRRTFEGHNVQLGLQKSDLIVQADHAAGVLEVVPSQIVDDKLPEHSIEEYVH